MFGLTALPSMPAQQAAAYYELAAATNDSYGYVYHSSPINYATENRHENVELFSRSTACFYGAGR